MSVNALQWGIDGSGSTTPDTREPKSVGRNMNKTCSDDYRCDLIGTLQSKAIGSAFCPMDDSRRHMAQLLSGPSAAAAARSSMPVFLCGGRSATGSKAGQGWRSLP